MDQVVLAWEKNARIVDRLAAAVTSGDLGLSLGEGEMDAAGHLCHIHGTRRWWISQIDPDMLAGSERLYVQNGEDWEPVRDLEVIRARLPESAAQVARLYQSLMESGAKPGPYEHPSFFVQHLLWHEGWHVGALLAILRLNGRELPEEWEEPAIWQEWRGIEESA